jgi:hypothetical protein
MNIGRKLERNRAPRGGQSSSGFARWRYDHLGQIVVKDVQKFIDDNRVK